MTKWIAALAAMSMIAAPATAQITRSATPVEENESLAGGLGPVWVAALLMVVAAVVILSGEGDDDDLPVSP